MSNINDPTVQKVFEVADSMVGVLPEEDWFVRQVGIPPDDLDRNDSRAVELWMTKCNELTEGVTTVADESRVALDGMLTGKELVAGPFLRKLPDGREFHYAYVRDSAL